MIHGNLLNTVKELLGYESDVENLKVGEVSKYLEDRGLDKVKTEKLSEALIGSFVNPDEIEEIVICVRLKEKSEQQKPPEQMLNDLRAINNMLRILNSLNLPTPPVPQHIFDILTKYKDYL